MTLVTSRAARRVLLTIGLGLLAAPSSYAAIVWANPSNYRSLLAGLRPGDTLSLASGVYTSGLPISGKYGTSNLPIAVLGPADKSAVFRANNCCNTVQLENVAYIRIQNLTLDGAGSSVAFAVDARGSTHHVTIENLKIVNYGADQQVVGISTKGPAWNWVIRGNRIVGAGTGMYLGNSDGTAPFVNGVIEYNTVLDTIGYNLQIKHQLARPTGIGLPTSDSRTVIRHNVWSKRSNASTGDLARPNVLVGHFPLSGTGSRDRYEIYGNFFYQNPTEVLFQGEGNLVVHDNVFVNSVGPAIDIQPHNDRPRAVTVYHNTVVATGTGIVVTGGDPAYRQAIIGNAAFAAVPVSGPNQSSNITGTYASAGNFFRAPYAPIGTLDLYPRPGKLSGTAISLAPFAAYVDGKRDFNGKLRTGLFRGAYEGEGTNPGWTLGLYRKPKVTFPASSAVVTPEP